jgi:hypothetical protein
MLKRIWLVARNDFFFYLRRPMVWVWLFLMLLMYWGLSEGAVQVQFSGDSAVSGKKLTLDNEFYNARTTAAFAVLIHGFFATVLFGLCVLRDTDLGVIPLLRSTRLKSTEYLAGKFLACTMIVLFVIACCMGLAIFFNQVLGHPGREEYFGAFKLSNYLGPYLKFALPHLTMVCGVAFAIGVIYRKPVLVFFFPVVVLILFIFLQEWSPVWLPNWVNDLIMCCEPSGMRWLEETFYNVDRGVDFYNEQPLLLEVPFLISRIAIAAIGALAVVLTVPFFNRSVKGAKNGALSAIDTVSNEPEKAAAGTTGTKSLAGLSMSSRKTGFLSDVWNIVRYELQELRRSPALYLFIPFIVLEVVGTSLFKDGAFGTQLLHTSGSLATITMETLSIYGCILLLFYTVESQLRERIKGLAPIFYSTQAKSFAMLMGKALANAGVAFLIIVASLVACFGMLLYQGSVKPDLIPFVLIWGAMLLPTYIVWSAFVTMVVVLTRGRYPTYALAMVALIGTLYLQLTGNMNWLSNWRISGALNWSDISVMEMDRNVIILNRLFMLAMAVLFVYVASAFYWRRQFDPVQIASRLKWKRVFVFLLKATPFLLLPLILGSLIWNRIEYGRQGSVVEDKQEDYWRANVATWTDLDQPSISGVNVALRIEPETSSLAVTGLVRLVNEHDEPLNKFAFTPGAHWNDLKWRIEKEFALNDRHESQFRLDKLINKVSVDSRVVEPDGDQVPSIPTDENLVECEPVDSSSLQIFYLLKPLMPGEHLTLEYSFSGQFPDGASSNGGGDTEFILPSGVVLTSFSPSFFPMVGFEESVGLDEDMQPDAEQRDFTFFEDELRPLMGTGDQFHVRTTVIGPEDYTFNCVGVKKSDEINEDGRTVVWESDQPVSFFNVVGGRYEILKGEQSEIYYSNLHPYNVDEMSEALESARIWYSRWFAPYPWKELRLSEFPAMATYAQGFATNITFSEGIGFLTKTTPGSNAAFMVTAHEAAHQWWGNILVPGDGPGGNILSEGMAHFSTGLLLDKVKGDHARIEFFKQIEKQYGDQRSLDSERPMVEVDGTKSGDGTVTYDRGGWVFWMLLNEMGRENCLQGMKAFITKYRDTDDYPVLQDFLILMRNFADDKEGYDQFIQQWFLDTRLGEYRFSDVGVEQDGDEWIISGTLENIGNSKMKLEIAATKNERFVEHETNEEYLDSRTTVELGEAESAEFEIRCDFEPDKVLVDPDAKVLQLNRRNGVHEF